jgi:WD40 repeat protein
MIHHFLLFCNCFQNLFIFFCLCRSNSYPHLLVSASADHTAKLWSPFTSTDVHLPLHTYMHPQSVTTVRWSCDGDYLVSGSFDGKVRVWDVRTGQIIHSFDQQQFVTALQTHPTDRNFFVAGGSKSAVSAWDMRTSQSVFAIESKFQLRSQLTCFFFTFISDEAASSKDCTAKPNLLIFFHQAIRSSLLRRFFAAIHPIKPLLFGTLHP